MSDSYTNTNMRADTLNQTAAHDTGIYDPNVHDNQIVAMYETDTQAQAARSSLLSNGIPERAIRITDRSQDNFSGGVDYERSDAGLWGAVKSLFMPDEEAHGYAEGVRRGHAILIVQPDATMDRHRIIEVLESSDPVDFDAKLEEWRQAGYSYEGSAGAVAAGATGAAVGVPVTTGVASDTSAMRATDTTAAGTFRNAPAPRTSENDYMSGDRADDLPGGAYEATRSTPTASSLATTPPATVTTIPGNTSATPATAALAPVSQDETIKVVEEQLRIGKREVVRGAVRVRSYVVERPVEEQVQLHEESVNVERHAVNRPVNAADGALFAERVIETRATGEEAVVGKEARVVEEIAVHKEATDRTETVRDTVRRTEVEIEGDPNAVGSVDSARAPGSNTASTAGATSSGTNVPKK